MVTPILGTPSQWSRKAQAFTLVELIFVVATVVMLGLVACFMWQKEKQKRDHERCKANLRSVGNAYQGWLNDSDYQLPWRVSQEKGGSLGKSKASEHYQVLSNHLSDPKILMCPTACNRTRYPTGVWNTLKDSNVSYAIAVDAITTGGLNFIAADFSIIDSTDLQGVGTCRRAGNIKVDKFDGKYGKDETYSAIWGPPGHQNSGEILFLDGSVYFADNVRLRRVLCLTQCTPDVSHILKP